MQNTSASDGGPASAARANSTPRTTTTSLPAQLPTEWPSESPTDAPTQRPTPIAPPGILATPVAVAGEAEIGGPSGPEPTRYGDWEKNGRCIDF
jgi:hypothetical protein